MLRYPILSKGIGGQVEQGISNSRSLLTEYGNILHFDILRFLVLRFCGSKQIIFSRKRNLPASAGSG
jgi:hypothetical protein